MEVQILAVVALGKIAAYLHSRMGQHRTSRRVLRRSPADYRISDSLSTSSTRPSGRARERRMLLMTLLITLAFLLAWSPYAAIALVAQFGPRQLRLSPYILTAASLLAKSATCYNPCIYAFADPGFRYPAPLTDFGSGGGVDSVQYWGPGGNG